jgi:hypothetical protein
MLLEYGNGLLFLVLMGTDFGNREKARYIFDWGECL